MELINIKISELKPHPKNPRKHPEDMLNKLKESITQFGFNNPVLISEDYMIIAGHARVKAAQSLGMDEVPAVVLPLEGAKADAYLILDNKLTEMSEWDAPLLVDMIEGIDAAGVDFKDIFFNAAEIDDLFSQVHSKDVEEDDFDIDAEIENEEKSIVKPGDIWLLGRHRLLCGDATNPEDMEKLMEGTKANVCVTDPPYNCDYSGGTGMKIQNDNMSATAFKEFLIKSFKNIFEHLVDGGAFYCFHSDAEKVNFYNSMVEAGFHYSTTCIWVKNSLVIGRMDFQMRHEPVLYGWKPTSKHKWYGGRKLTTVWEFNRPTRSKLHPTCKPLDLIGFPIKNSSLENSVILDPFGGSGSTLMACEQLNRICYTSEIDPKYATVIVKRYLDTIGTQEDVYLLRDGKKIPFADVPKPDGDDETEEEIL